LLNIACLVLTRFRPWPVLEYIAGAATILWYGAWLAFSFHSSHPDDVLVATVFAFAFYIQFCFTQSRWLWAAAQLLGPVAIFNTFNDPDQFLPLLFLFAVGGLIVAEIRRWDIAPSWTLTCYWVVCGFSKGSTPELRFAYITGAFVLFFLWIVWWGLIRQRALRNTDLLVMVANAAAYFGASYFLLNPQYHVYMGLLAAALGGLHLFLARLVWKDRQAALLGIAVTVTFLTLAIPIQFGGFRITMAWALEGAALAWLSTRFESLKMSIGSSIVLTLAVLRLLMVDSLIPDQRFLTFAVAATALFLASRFFQDRAQAGVAYVAGHFVTLVALGIQLADWVARSVAKPDQFQTATVLISILMAVYAVFLITLGVATRTALNRILGLVLMALVVLKLYLSDVWELGNLFKIVAFLGLSVLLLSVSYLYSRFRPAIEKLWKDDPGA
jgi:uncharacterized membrane protein